MASSPDLKSVVRKDVRVRFPEKCARQCEESVAFLRNSLIKLAVIAWESNSKNLELDIEQVRNTAPTFEANQVAGKLTDPSLLQPGLC
jgi:hypothetical protein